MGRKSRFSKEQWAGFIAEQAASGLSAAKFCKQRKLRLPTFYQQRRTLSAKARERTDSSTLIPLQVVAADLTGADLPDLSAPLGKGPLREFAKVRELVAHHDVVGGDVADHAGHPAIARHARERRRDNLEEFLG